MTQAEWRRLWMKRGGSQPAAGPGEESPSLAVRGTIAPLVTVEGTRMNQVRGFGLVVDLVDTGGRDGPEIVRNFLVKEMRRQQEIGGPGLPPLDVLNSRDSTMVELTGFVPAGARKGDRFDVYVRAMGSEAKSLVGGRLVLGDLRRYAETPSGVLSGKTVAIASGPLFVSPFDRHGRPTDHVDLRRGVVLGGGLVRKPRKIRLVLTDPSPSVAKKIERQLNDRYAGESPIALGESASLVELITPPDYRDRRAYFLNRVLHTPLDANRQGIQARIRGLIREFKGPEPDYNSIALALEAVGKIALPEIQRLYGDASRDVRFFAARTGLRLADRDGLEIVAREALDPKSPFRMQAIYELGWALRMYASGEYLRKLLDDPDNTVRIAAYKALRSRPHPAIESKVLDKDNLILDSVDSGGAFLVYIHRARVPRIALFGRQMRCRPPAMFPGERDDGRRLVTQLSADVGDDCLTFKFRNKRNGRVSPDLKAPFGVAELIAFLGDAPRQIDGEQRVGFAVPYSEIVDILSTFCESGTIPAKLVLEGLEDRDAESSNEREESEF
ncbi:MAG: flagellar basal body P-ring protein FlgI [Phycisphaerae bacterium]